MKLCNCSSTVLSPQERRGRILYLVIAIAAIATSYALNLSGPIPWLGCPLLRYTGIPCPGWGLTRSFMATMRGDWHQALSYHLFGPLLLAALFVATLQIGLELFYNYKIRGFHTQIVQKTPFQLFCFLVIFSYHGVRLQALWQAGQLYPSLLHSPLSQFLSHYINLS